MSELHVHHYHRARRSFWAKVWLLLAPARKLWKVITTFVPFYGTLRSLVLIIVILVGWVTYHTAIGTEDVPHVPFVSCGPNGQPQAPVGGVQGIAHQVGATIRETAKRPPSVEEVRDAMVPVFEAAGEVWGTVENALAGGEAPVENLPDQEGDLLEAAACGPCPGTLTPIEGDPDAKGIDLAANAALSTPWTRTQAITAVAVAGAESGYREKVVNPLTIDGSNATGLWQTMWPMHRDLYDGGNPKDAFDNAAVAYLLWEGDGGSFSSPWAATYGVGSHLPHMAEAERAVDRVLADQSQETRVTLAAVEAGAGGKGCDTSSTVPVGDVGAKVWPIPGDIVYQTAYNLGHGGMDINRGSGSDDLGDPIVAAQGGTVTCAGHEEECYGYGGKTLTIMTYSGRENLYTHLQAHPLVEEGDKVVTGQLVGYVGNTGNSSAPHLHFEDDVHDGTHQTAAVWLPDPSTFPGVPGLAA